LCHGDIAQVDGQDRALASRGLCLAKNVRYEYNTAHARSGQIRFPFRPARGRVRRYVMSKSTSAQLSESAGFLGGLLQQIRLGLRLYRDSRVPGWVKLIPVAGLLYFFSPIDLIPDLALPGLGEVDDVVLLLLALKMFVDLAPLRVVQEHMEDLFGRQREPSSDSYIEVPYEIVDGDE
jgi:uncharacterized membrane protein YkvA (DUF1232 family)